MPGELYLGLRARSNVSEACVAPIHRVRYGRIVADSRRIIYRKDKRDVEPIATDAEFRMLGQLIEMTRVAPLPRVLEARLAEYLESARNRHLPDLAVGLGETHLPAAPRRKHPKASREWKWQYCLSSAKVCAHPRTGPAGVAYRWTSCLSNKPIPDFGYFLLAQHLDMGIIPQ